MLRPSGAVSPLRLPPEVLDYWDSEASQDIEATPLPHFLPYDLLSDKRRSISTAAAPPSSGAMGFDKFQVHSVTGHPIVDRRHIKTCTD